LKNDIIVQIDWTYCLCSRRCICYEWKSTFK